MASHLQEKNKAETEELLASFATQHDSMDRRRRGHHFPLTFCLVVMTLISLLWAVWATFAVIDFGQAVNEAYESGFQTNLEFVASPKMNADHFRHMEALVGPDAGPFVCVYNGNHAECRTEEKDRVAIWFTPTGPVYKLGISGGETDVVVQTYPFHFNSHMY